MTQPTFAYKLRFYDDRGHIAQERTFYSSMEMDAAYDQYVRQYLPRCKPTAYQIRIDTGSGNKWQRISVF